MKRVLIALAWFVLCSNVFSQSVITGVVKNENNEALTGASLIINESSEGTTSDKNGSFSIATKQQGLLTLTVSYLGYETIRKEVNPLTKQLHVFVLKQSSILSDEVIVSAVRAGSNTPTTYTNVSKEELTAKNLGQDVPYLLANQPSTVVTSDAGTGIGYTGMRIRGVDSRQINVTINGVPLNDAESHGVFWVDVPDIAGSTNSMQIQRGVGTSTNGSGAFGGSINLNTDNISNKAYTAYTLSGGSFNTLKASAAAGTGLINDHWFAEGKYSIVKSDGYRDRARADMSSYFAQAGYKSDKTLLKLMAFGGREETYQAWYSVTEDEMDMYGRTYNSAGLLYDENWGIGGYYDNFIDHYEQDHFQLHLIQQLTSQLTLNAALHYTNGRGYYEEYMQEEMLFYYPMEFYNIDPLYFGQDSVLNENGGYNTVYNDTVNYSDVVRRLWLDNDFYGATWNLKYQTGNLELQYGGAYNKLDNGQHFGEVIWARYAGNTLPGNEFYRNASNKSDFNNFVKANFASGNFNFYADLQYRHIDYNAGGLDREWTSGDRSIDIDKQYNFFNPKAGMLFNFSESIKIYGSYALAHREPSRSDFLDAPGGIEPKPESLHDVELGLKTKAQYYNFEVVLYNMMYRDQLVMTGELNGVGTPIRKNVGESYRRGLEVLGNVKPIEMFELSGNLTLSTNKTSYKSFDQESGFVDFKDVNISYSPSLVGNLGFYVYPVKGLSIAWLSNYVGEQYVTNTSDDQYKMDDYSVSNLHLSYSLDTDKSGKYVFNLWVNNVLDAEYSSKADIHWSGALGYFPQAGRNVLAGINVAF